MLNEIEFHSCVGLRGLAVQQRPGSVKQISILASLLAMGCIRLDSQSVERRKELLALTEEKPIGRETGDCSHGPAKLIAQRTNDRDMG